MVEHLMVEICQSKAFCNRTGYKTGDSDTSKEYEDTIKEVLTHVLWLEDMMQCNHETQLAQIRQNNFAGPTNARTDPHGRTHNSQHNPHGSDP